MGRRASGDHVGPMLVLCWPMLGGARVWPCPGRLSAMTNGSGLLVLCWSYVGPMLADAWGCPSVAVSRAVVRDDEWIWLVGPMLVLCWSYVGRCLGVPECGRVQGGCPR